MISFDPVHKAVHYPPDRRFRIWIRPSFVAGAVVLILVPLGIAWIQAAIFGLPYIPPIPQFSQTSATAPHGFHYGSGMRTSSIFCF
jgi:sulfoxide reductase catalytic subunit YedY